MTKTFYNPVDELFELVEDLTDNIHVTISGELDT